MNEFGADFFANKKMSNMSKRDKPMNIYIENLHLHNKILTIFYHKCMEEGACLEGETEKNKFYTVLSNLKLNLKQLQYDTWVVIKKQEGIQLVYIE